MPKFVPRERKHRRLAKQKQHTVSSEQKDQSNAETIVPETKSVRDVRRAQLAAELREQQPADSKVSGKKRKRLDKYIDTKLKKEENLELLKKLAAHKVDTSLLQSSKKLGRVTESKRERFSRALREEQAGIDVNGDHAEILLQQRKEPKSVPEQHGSDDEDEDDEEDDDFRENGADVSAFRPGDSTNEQTEHQIGFGSGLKRPLNVDDSGKPVLKKRKRRKLAKATMSLPEPGSDSEDEGTKSDSDEGINDYVEGNPSGSESEEWHGFDSDPQEEIDGRVGIDVNLSSDEDASGTEPDDDSSGEEDDDDDESSGEEASDTEDRETKSVRVSAFKAWADTQRNAAVGFTPSTAPTNDETIRATFRPRTPSPDPLLESIPVPTAESTYRPASAITIPRSDEVQNARLALPVVQEEQKIMEAIHAHPVTVICGATGSGKTTQVPQMMYESGYASHIGAAEGTKVKTLQSRGMIGVTQPRRVAAMSVAERVATELGSEYRKRVAHQVRYDTNVSRESAIKFMTDGILLREISQDFVLSKYSAIVIDEAHERSVNTDILIGMLSRIVGLRSELAKEEPEKHCPLKLVIMSATLRVADFAQNQRLFRKQFPPIVQAEGRQFPVTEHFSRKTRRDYVSEMVSKLAKGHRKLPPGGMLVFLTAQNEIQTAIAQLKEKLGSGSIGFTVRNHSNKDLKHMPLDVDDFDDGPSKPVNEYLEGEDTDQESEPDIIGLDQDVDDEEFEVEHEDVFHDSRSSGVLKPHILPLYAALPSAQQLKVFDPPPDGHRLIVVATNVAETSLTIPGIRYVFDCGRSKEKRYDISTGVQTFEIDWISKASASQRAGRAGRTGPGHCYRLYSSAIYEQFFAEHAVPEILRTPLESTVLQLKSMEIDNVVNFPFPTPPDAAQLAQADRLLRNLGAIDDRTGRISDSGKDIMAFPVSPRFGKMLLLAQRNQVLASAIALVAGLAVGELIIPEVRTGTTSANEGSDSEDDYAKKRLDTAAKTAAQKRHQAYTRAQAILAKWDDQSDAIKLLTAVAAHTEAASKKQTIGAATQFCDDFFLREKGMMEVQQLRHQLHNIVSARYPTQAGTFKDTISLPSEKERKMLNQIVASGFIDQIAIRADLLKEATSGFGRKPRRAAEVAYRTLAPSSQPDKALSLQDQEIQKSVFVHPSSVLAHLSVDEMPGYVVYSHLSKAPASAIGEGAKVPRTRMHPLTAIGAKQVAALAEGTPLLRVGKPIGKIEEVNGENGRKRECWVGIELQYPESTGSSPWPLGTWRVLQKRLAGGVWAMEKVLAR